LPIAIEHGGSRRRQLNKPQIVADGVVVVRGEPDLLGVERLRPVDVGDGHGDELELPVHALIIALRGVRARTRGVGPACFGKLRGMTTRGYTVLGWLAWQILSRVVGRTVAQNKVKLGAAATVAAVVAAGVVAARASSGDD
jgi:hypothetical protein